MNRHFFEHTDEIVHALMKISAFADLAEEAGKKLYGLKGKTKDLFQGAGEAGTRFAKGIGVSDEHAGTVGKTLGYGTLGGAGLYAAGKGYRKTQDFRHRHNFGRPPEGYYGY